MFYGIEQKIETARRLKQLRNNFNNGEGISHEKLAEILNEKYADQEKNKKKNKKEEYDKSETKEGIISIGVLKNYEVTDFGHTKFDAGYGMNISYLTMLADFYNVSTDYLLAITDIKSPDDNIRGIHEKTGLSEPAIESIIKMNNNEEFLDLSLVQLLNRVLEFPGFNLMLYRIDILKMDYINKLAYEKMTRIIGDTKTMELYLGEISGLQFHSKEGNFTTLTLSPAEYYDFSFIRMKEKVCNFIEDFISNESKDRDLEPMIKDISPCINDGGSKED
ncbi:MAG: hypothetical protein JJE17_01710 [Peptostreptococcaceae bacterium]|nr:hypothetical protein [Peptostreptococcaceae bacterium]